jgi:hypothetical protein
MKKVPAGAALEQHLNKRRTVEKRLWRPHDIAARRRARKLKEAAVVAASSSS